MGAQYKNWTARFQLRHFVTSTDNQAVFKSALPVLDMKALLWDSTS